MKVAKQERNPQRGGNAGSTSQPITRHPLFPAIVALWFAALFGVVGVLLGTPTIERAVAATGLAKAIPMAAPPLGSTARLLVALGLTGIGGLVGALIGLRLSARNSPRAEAMHDLTGGEIEEAEDEPAAVGRLPGRRRSFTTPIEPVDEAASEPSAAPAPASGIFQLSDLEDDDLDARATAALAAARVPDFTPIEPEIDEDEAIVPGYDSDDDDATPAHLTDAFSPAAWADPIHSPEIGEIVGDYEDEDEDEDEGAPVARLFDAYARTLEARDLAVAEAEQELGTAAAPALPKQEQETPESAASERVEAAMPPPNVQPASPGAERIAAAHLDDLSPVELLERLALAMEEQRRKRALAQAASFSVVPFATKAPQGTQLDSGDVAGAPETQHFEDIEAAPQDPAPQAPPVAPILQRLSSLGATAPFAPPPFAPPPFGARQPLPAAEPGDEPVQPGADFASDAPRETDAIGGWSDGGAAIVEASPQAETPERTDAEPSAPVPVPAALRPVETIAFDEDDTIPGYIPPRRIIMPSAPTSAADVPDTETSHSGERPLAGLAGGHDFAPDPDGEDDDDESLASFADEDAFADDGEDIVEEGVLDEGYSSLLSLQRRAEPRSRPISIEDETGFDEEAGTEGSAHAMAGQAMAGTQTEDYSFAATDEAPQPCAQPSLPGARLFDPPGRPDPAETEKALRAALATLQRMSGAA
ncbi:hypothetical protein WBP06_16450 [Novosphingobium sp. BL-8H]|uniref:hypothetical protein n=1 Tax=Novosphingobium sp. BL-8H TaxID=3127640 RepID=UPI0037580688